MSAEPVKVEEPLRLSCGHLLSAVVTGSEGTMFCGACASLAGLVQGEAEAVVPARMEEGDEDEEDAEEPVVEDADPETADVQIGEPPDQGRAQAHGAEEQPQDGASPGLALAQPFHSIRSEMQGRRGCWAVSVKTGEPCGAPNLRGQDYCSAHSGLGVSGAPAEYAPKALEAKKRNAAIRSEVRMMYGSSRQGGARQVLRAAVEREAIALAGRAVGAALDKNADPIRAANLALKVIETADPGDSATLTVSTTEDIDNMSLIELLAFADAHGIDYSRPAEIPPAPPPQAFADS